MYNKPFGGEIQMVCNHRVFVKYKANVVKVRIVFMSSAKLRLGIL